jgi:hypothetical protein
MYTYIDIYIHIYIPGETPIDPPSMVDKPEPKVMEVLARTANFSLFPRVTFTGIGVYDLSTKPPL